MSDLTQRPWYKEGDEVDYDRILYARMIAIAGLCIGCTLPFDDFGEMPRNQSWENIVRMGAQYQSRMDYAGQRTVSGLYLVVSHRRPVKLVTPWGEWFFMESFPGGPWNFLQDILNQFGAVEYQSPQQVNTEDSTMYALTQIEEDGVMEKLEESCLQSDSARLCDAKVEYIWQDIQLRYSQWRQRV